MTKDWLDERRARSRLFILGAGFSAGAGIPMTATLLRSAIDLMRQEAPALAIRIERIANTYAASRAGLDWMGDHFPEFCTYLHYREFSEFGGGERWSERGSREVLVLRYYLAKAIDHATPRVGEVPDLYTEFAKQLLMTDFVLSLNWDCLLEAALCQLGRRVTYEISGGLPTLAKLHGSINWRVRPPPCPRLNWHPMNFDHGMMREDVLWTLDLLHEHRWSEFPPLMGELEPCIVLPGLGKTWEARCLAPLWYGPGIAFDLTSDVYVIGLSLSPEDYVLRCLLMDWMPTRPTSSEARPRKIVIINPDPEVRHSLDFLADAKNVTFVEEPFGLHHVKAMTTTAQPT